MRKLTYAIALCTLLLAGCSQDEAIVESKGELVTLNYNVSLGNGVQSRAEADDLAVNKLLCVIFEEGKEIKRDTVGITNGTATYSPKLFANIEYQIVFWAYYERANGTSCFDMTNVTAIKANENYGKEGFAEDKYMDAYTAVDKIKLSDTAQTPSVTLIRPFSQVNVLSSVIDYNNAVELGSTPTTCQVNLSGFANQYDALSGTWDGTASNTIIASNVSTATKVIKNEVEYYYYASGYVFGTGNVSTCVVIVYDQNNKEIYRSMVENVPLVANQRTNMSNDNLLTGGGVTYTVTVSPNFSEQENNFPY